MQRDEKMIARLTLVYAVVIAALALVGGSAVAQDEVGEVAVRSVPVEASTVSAISRSAESIMSTDMTVLNDASRAATQPATVVAVQESVSSRQGVNLVGGIESALAASVSDSAMRLEPIVAGTSSKRISTKEVVLRLFGGTLIFGLLGTVSMLVFSRMTGGQGAAT